MPLSRYKPEWAGSATIAPSGPVEAGSWQSFELTYTAGKFGIDDQGGIAIVMRTASDQSRLQIDDPQGASYCTAEASNGAVLALDYDGRNGIRPWFKRLRVRVVKHFLAEGDTITIRIGDRRFGGPGIRMQTFCEPTYEFKVLADPIATTDFVELPDQPTLAIVPGLPERWKAVLPTLKQPGEPFRLGLKAEDVWGNPSDRIERTVRLVADRPVAGLPESVTFRAGERAKVVKGLSVADECDLAISVLAADGTPLATSNVCRISSDYPYRQYWSDLHGQSEETVGTNSAREYFAFARDLAFLDLAGHQGNDFQITDAFWAELNRLTAEFDSPGRFVCLPGFEWSGNTNLGGDHNVWYRTEGRPIFRSSRALIADDGQPETDAFTLPDLFEQLQGEDALVVAHCGGRYADVTLAHDGALEPSVEVHSSWGTFPWIVDDALKSGYRVGIVAASDGHKGRLGAEYPGASLFGCYGGYTCHLMPDLSRDALFESFRRRNHFATTGTRLFMEASVDLPSGGTIHKRNPDLGPTETWEAQRALMGDIVKATDDAVTFTLDVAASSPIERIELRDGLETLEVMRPYTARDLGARIRVVWEGAEYRGRGRMVSWDGHLYLHGNRIRQARAINFWNADNRLESRGDTGLAWKAVTTGSFGGADIWLEDAAAGRIEIDTAQGRFELLLEDIGFEDRVFECGGLGKRLRVYRLPERLTARTLRWSRKLAVRGPGEGDTRPYVCLTQEDGHQAWSSPIYLFR
ncbi:MAG: DUF3604 domain-containing protein [Alphaproteobacteria bacterium]|nr:DUF3604 domain-containing protein [Alphaproteobacteria bacterium]MCB9929850.1 DUF3604 domain-containing protein [Alphaproteobacteria bacterium]